VNPAPGGGGSASVQFRLLNPVPVVDSVRPDSLRLKEAAEVQLFGLGFVHGSTVWLDDVAFTPRSVTDRSVLLDVPAAGPPGRDGRIRIEAPTPGGGFSNEVAIGIQERIPSVSATVPQALEVAGGPQTVRVTGTDFAPDAVIVLDGVPRATTLVDATTLEFQASPSDVDSTGAQDLLVLNPRGGGPSAAVALSTVPAGRVAYSYRFEYASLVTARLNGADRATNLTDLAATSIDAWPTGRDLLITKGIGYFDIAPGLFRVTPGVGETTITNEEVRAPRVTADASWIYFYRGPDIYRIRPDGTGTELVAGGAPDSANLRNPDPSPTGDRVIYSRNRPNRPSRPREELVILDMQASTTMTLAIESTEARWSPDGSWLAYRDRLERLRLVRPDGTDDQAVPGVTFRVGEGSFDWSPDSRFVVVIYGGAFQVLELATGEVLTVPRADCGCAWGEYPTTWFVSWYADPDAP
jgi:hypothetical protein